MMQIVNIVIVNIVEIVKGQKSLASWGRSLKVFVCQKVKVPGSWRLSHGSWRLSQQGCPNELFWMAKKL